MWTRSEKKNRDKRQLVHIDLQNLVLAAKGTFGPFSVSHRQAERKRKSPVGFCAPEIELGKNFPKDSQRLCILHGYFELA